MIICVSRSFSGAIGLHRPDCAPYPALPVNVIQRRRGRKRRRVSKHAPSPLAGVCNGRVWNAPSIPQKMLGASSTCPLQTDTKPWSRSGLGEVGEGDWSVGRASRCGIALPLRTFFYHAKPQSRKEDTKEIFFFPSFAPLRLCAFA
jgi:hypothetical protein